METQQLVVNRGAWRETYERSYENVFRDLVARGARPDEAAAALKTAFLSGYEDGEDECSPAWLLTAASQVLLRPRWYERLFAPSGTRPEKILALIAAVGLAAPLFVVVVMVADPMPGLGERPVTPAPIAIATMRVPTPPPFQGALPEPSAWGAMWSLVHDLPVLRPTWLAQRDDDGVPVVNYVVSGTTVHGFGTTVHGFGVGAYHAEYYFPRRLAVGSVVPSIWLSAGSSDYVQRLLLDGEVLGRAREPVVIRGLRGELVGSGRPYWQVVWTERGYRYAIQAFGFTREDVLRIAESLAPVVDASGRVRVDHPAPFVTADRW